MTFPLLHRFAFGCLRPITFQGGNGLVQLPLSFCLEPRILWVNVLHCIHAHRLLRRADPVWSARHLPPIISPSLCHFRDADSNVVASLIPRETWI